MVSRDKPIILVSGGFDPIHEGHIAMLKEAAKYGYVWVAINSDGWLLRNRGYVLMPFESRAEVILSIRYVEAIYKVDDKDGTVCDALRSVKPDYFGNGGDRVGPNHSEARYCELHNIKQVFGLGGEKINSSSKLVEKIR